MGLADIKIRLDAMGRGTVLVNGEDIADRISGLRLDSTARGDITRLTVELVAGDVDFEGEGIVRVVPPDDRVSFVEFLSNVDPGRLEKESLERLGGFGGPSTTEAILDVLKEWASGDD